MMRPTTPIRLAVAALAAATLVLAAPVARATCAPGETCGSPGKPGKDPARARACHLPRDGAGFATRCRDVATPDPAPPADTHPPGRPPAPSPPPAGLPRPGA